MDPSTCCQLLGNSGQPDITLSAAIYTKLNITNRLMRVYTMSPIICLSYGTADSCIYPNQKSENWPDVSADFKITGTTRKAVTGANVVEQSENLLVENLNHLGDSKMSQIKESSSSLVSKSLVTYVDLSKNPWTARISTPSYFMIDIHYRCLFVIRVVAVLFAIVLFLAYFIFDCHKHFSFLQSSSLWSVDVHYRC